MSREYIEEKECHRLNQAFLENLELYKKRSKNVSDKEWLKRLIVKKCSHISEEQAEAEASEIMRSIEAYDRNLASVEEACSHGVSKEKWLEDRLQEAAIGLSAAQYSTMLQNIDNILYQNNRELADALSRSSDGHVMMSRNLDGNIAEHMIARTTELQGYIQNKNIKVEVRGVNTANSVDVRATVLDTGKFQNYQLKFGKDAKATIRLIEGGNYNNQQIVVPSEQMEEIKAYFNRKGSEKTITDHIEINGVKGRSFTKTDMKNLQKQAQEDGIMPVLDDYYYSTKEYALSIGKNVGIMALQMAAVTTGIDLVSRVCQGEELHADEMVEGALRTGADTGVKVVASGTLHVAVRNEMIPFLSKSLSTNMITSIAFVGIENTKILLKMAEGKLSTVKGLDHMGRVTVSMAGGLWCMALAKGALEGVALGGIVGVGVGIVAGMAGYAAGSGVGSKVYSAAKKVAHGAKELAKKAFSDLRSIKDRWTNKIRSAIVN